jgi:5'-3' exonuclease
MGKALKGNYISQSFEDRIEINLANISRSPEDQFVLKGIRYIPATFKCELCGHEPCLYAFTVFNVQTETDMVVGSECVHHFKDKSSNIDLSSGLIKRVKSVTRKMRRYMKHSIDEELYKAMTPEKKREMTLRLFMKYQVIEALKDEDGKKVKLSKEDVLHILDGCPEPEPYERKSKKARRMTPDQRALRKARKQIQKINDKPELSVEDKKEKKRAQDRARYYQHKVELAAKSA